MTETYTARDLPQITPELSTFPARDLVEWANDNFGDRLTLACSLGAEDIVLLDMFCSINPRPRVFVIDTGRLHEETYRTLEKCRERFGIEFEIYSPKTESVQALVRQKGPFSFYESVENRQECCGIRKVEPLRRALANVDAWMTGLRRQQSVTRLGLEAVETDATHRGIYKINPLANWTEEEVWEYVREKRLPYNKLHDSGYPSIGCEPCTRPIKPGEDLRAGRWWWESADHKECGLHVRP